MGTFGRAAGGSKEGVRMLCVCFLIVCEKVPRNPRLKVIEMYEDNTLAPYLGSQLFF